MAWDKPPTADDAKAGKKPYRPPNTPPPSLLDFAPPTTSGVALLCNGYLRPVIGRDATRADTGLPRELLQLIAEYSVARVNSTLKGSFEVKGQEVNEGGSVWVPNLVLQYDCHTGGALTGQARYDYANHPTQLCDFTGFMYNGCSDAAHLLTAQQEPKRTSHAQHVAEAQAMRNALGHPPAAGAGAAAGDGAAAGFWDRFFSGNKRRNSKPNAAAPTAAAAAAAAGGADGKQQPLAQAAAAAHAYDPFTGRALASSVPHVWALQWAMKYYRDEHMSADYGTYTYTGWLVQRRAGAMSDDDMLQGTWYCDNTGAHGTFQYRLHNVQHHDVSLGIEEDHK